MRGQLYCSHCGEKVTGSKSKGATQYYFYYHCNHCHEFRASADLVNKSFLKKLKEIKVELKVKELYAGLFSKTYSENSSFQKSEAKDVDSQIDKIKIRKEKVQDKFADGEIENDEFNDIISRYNTEIRKLELQKEKQSEVLSANALSSELTDVLGYLNGISHTYENADLTGKQRIISSTFPGKITFSENKCRTSEVNEVIVVLSRFNAYFRRNKKRLNKNNSVQSPRVDPERIELSSKQALNMLSTCVADY